MSTSAISPAPTTTTVFPQVTQSWIVLAPALKSRIPRSPHVFTLSPERPALSVLKEAPLTVVRVEGLVEINPQHPGEKCDGWNERQE